MRFEEFYNERAFEEMERPTDDRLVKRLRCISHFVNHMENGEVLWEDVFSICSRLEGICLAMMLPDIWEGQSD